MQLTSFSVLWERGSRQDRVWLRIGGKWEARILVNVPLHLTSPSRWPFSRLIISFNRHKPGVSWVALLQHGYVARGACGIRRSEPGWVVQLGSAGLVEVLPQVGPSWVSAGAQTLSPPSTLRGADVLLWGPVASSCCAASVELWHFKFLPCYFNLSSLVTASSLSRGGVCVLQVSAHYLCRGPVQLLVEGKTCTVASCTSLTLSSGDPAACPPQRIFYAAEPELEVLFSPKWGACDT